MRQELVVPVEAYSLLPHRVGALADKKGPSEGE